MPSFAFPARKNRKKRNVNGEAHSFLRRSFFFFAVALIFTADRISKNLVLLFLPENHSIPVMPGVFHLTRVNNTGAAFGLFRGARFFLVAMTLVSVTVLLFFLWRGSTQMRRMQRWGWWLVIGGAFGNLYDRLVYHYVIDFLDFRIWPVFNLADSFVCVGVFLVIWSALRD